LPKSAKKKAVGKEPARAQRAGIDPIGASKDGHQFHEAWLARRSMGLLLSLDELCGIAVEGLSQDIEEGAPKEAIEIADATFYYGEQPTFAGSPRIEVTQFKYSVARSTTPMRVVEPSEADRKAISTLSEHNVHSFNKRFDALGKTKGR
jgi:hypothetical protein